MPGTIQKGRKNDSLGIKPGTSNREDEVHHTNEENKSAYGSKPDTNGGECQVPYKREKANAAMEIQK